MYPEINTHMQMCDTWQRCYYTLGERISQIEGNEIYDRNVITNWGEGERGLLQILYEKA